MHIVALYTDYECVAEWKKRIMQYFVHRSKHNRMCRAARKDDVMETFGCHKDSNAELAWKHLVDEGLLLCCPTNHDNRDDYYLPDVFGKPQIVQIVDEKIPLRSQIMQPDKSETRGLKQRFTEMGFRTHPAQSTYYYYTKKDDDSFWICLHKTKPNSKATRIILGSLNSKDSRIRKIWDATLQAAKHAGDEPFARKRVEDIEPRACGNNRLPSKAAFDVFVWTKLLTRVNKGKKPLYKIKK